MNPGDQITPTKDTPKPLAAALGSNQTLVVSFLMPGSADDRQVADALLAVRRTPIAKRGVRFITYQLGRNAAQMGQAADLLGVVGTPSIAVIDSSGKLQTRWLGIVDQPMLTQAISDTSPPGAAPKKKPKVKKTKIKKGPAKAAPVAGKKAPKAGTPARPASTKSASLTGDARSLALAAQVNAAYATVPGVRSQTTTLVKGVETKSTRLVAMSAGKTTGIRETVMSASVVRTLSRPEGMYTKSGSAACWTKGSPRLADFSAIIDNGAVKASPTGKSLDLTSADGVKLHFVLDPVTKRLKSLTLKAGPTTGTATFEELTTTPEVSAPKPIC